MVKKTTHTIHTEPIEEQQEKQPKPKVEQTNQEFVSSFINTKQKYSDRLSQQKEEQDNIIEVLNSPTKFPHAPDNQKKILLNERRKLVSKFIQKIPTQKSDETEKEQTNRLKKLYELRKNVTKFDAHYCIETIHLDTDDYRYM
jgi:hypothetical protein